MRTEIRPIGTDDALAYELNINAPPELVWRYWTEPDRLVRWMGDVATLQPQPGGAFRLEYESGDVAAGAFVEVDAPRRLVFTWGWEAPGDPVPPGASTIEVTLDPLDGGAATLLRLRHAGLPDESSRGHDEGWHYFLGRLSEAIAGGA